MSARAGNRDAGSPYLAGREGVVGVVAGLGRKVECYAEAGLSLFEEVAVPGVRLFRRGEAGVLPHRPDAAAVHVGLDAAGVGVLAGVSEGVGVVEFLEVFGGVDGIDLDAGVGLEAVAPLSEPFLDRLKGALSFHSCLLLEGMGVVVVLLSSHSKTRMTRVFLPFDKLRANVYSG